MRRVVVATTMRTPKGTNDASERGEPSEPPAGVVALRRDRRYPDGRRVGKPEIGSHQRGREVLGQRDVERVRDREVRALRPRIAEQRAHLHPMRRRRRESPERSDDARLGCDAAILRAAQRSGCLHGLMLGDPPFSAGRNPSVNAFPGRSVEKELDTGRRVEHEPGHSASARASATSSAAETCKSVGPSSRSAASHSSMVIVGVSGMRTTTGSISESSGRRALATG